MGRLAESACWVATQDDGAPGRREARGTLPVEREPVLVAQRMLCLFKPDAQDEPHRSSPALGTRPLTRDPPSHRLSSHSSPSSSPPPMPHTRQTTVPS